MDWDFDHKDTKTRTKKVLCVFVSSWFNFVFCLKARQIAQNVTPPLWVRLLRLSQASK